MNNLRIKLYIFLKNVWGSVWNITNRRARKEIFKCNSVLKKIIFQTEKDPSFLLKNMDRFSKITLKTDNITATEFIGSNFGKQACSFYLHLQRVNKYSIYNWFFLRADYQPSKTRRNGNTVSGRKFKQLFSRFRKNFYLSRITKASLQCYQRYLLFYC